MLYWEIVVFIATSFSEWSLKKLNFLYSLSKWMVQLLCFFSWVFVRFFLRAWIFVYNKKSWLQSLHINLIQRKLRENFGVQSRTRWSGIALCVYRLWIQRFFVIWLCIWMHNMWWVVLSSYYFLIGCWVDVDNFFKSKRTTVKKRITEMLT